MRLLWQSGIPYRVFLVRLPPLLAHQGAFLDRPQPDTGDSCSDRRRPADPTPEQHRAENRTHCHASRNTTIPDVHVHAAPISSLRSLMRTHPRHSLKLALCSSSALGICICSMQSVHLTMTRT